MDTGTNAVAIGTSAILPTESNNILALYKNLVTQANTLIFELNAFTHYISCQPSSHQPKISLSKFGNDVQREINLLHQHGTAIGLNEPQPQNPSNQPSDNEELTTNMALREPSALYPSEPQTEEQPAFNLDTSSSAHRIRSSNIVHLATLWTLMKQCTGFQAVRKQVRYLPCVGQLRSSTPSSKNNRNARMRNQKAEQDSTNVDEQHTQADFSKPSKGAKGPRRHEKEPMTVDIVAQHGGLWIKLYTKTLAWTVMDLAKEGCVDLASPSPSSDGGNLDEVEETMLAEIKLVKMAREILAAARSERFGPKHEHPKVCIHLTRISRGKWPDMDVVIRYVEDMGVEVICATDIALPGGPPTGEGFESHTTVATDESMKESNRKLDDVFSRMTASPPAPITTQTLNIDSTLLITLISDISHLNRDNVTIPSHYHGRVAGKDIEKQLESELSDPLLPNHIYPILAGKRLVCTAKAAAHVRNLVDVMGSSTETKRSRIFLPVGPQDARNREELAGMLTRVTQHDVPNALQLPIDVVEAESDSPITDKPTGSQSLEEDVMERLAHHLRLSPGNRSVIFHGWRQGITTVSLNRVVSEWLNRAINATLDELEAESDTAADVVAERGFSGPLVLICGRERSLLGSEFDS